MKQRLLSMGALGFGLALVVTPQAALATSGQNHREVPILLDASTILPVEWRQGENFQVAEEVENDGLFNRYTLKTDYGREAVETTAALKMRIQELNALKAMLEMERQQVFGDSLVAAAKAPFRGAAALVTSPIETSKGIAQGTGRFFSNLGRSVFSGDPDQDNVLKVALGYDAVKRQFAYDFRIDPYTDFEPLVDRLGEISRAAVAGGVTPRAALAAINTPVAAGISLTATAESMRQLVRDNPPGELRKINRAKLAQMGVGEDLAEAFLDNYSFNPQEKTLLVGALETMSKVKARDVAILEASLSQDRSEARYNRLRAQMLAGYAAKVEAEAEVVNAGGTVALRRNDGKLILLAPVDFVSWTEGIEQKLATLDRAIANTGAFSGKELWITGKIDPAARMHFEAAGWEVNEDQNALLKD